MATTDATPRRAAGNKLIIQTVVPVLQAAAAYDALDALHTNDLMFPGMARASGGAGIIRAMHLIDKDDQGIAAILWLFSAALSNTTHTVNAAFAPDDADAASYVGSIATGTYRDGNVNQEATTLLELPYVCAAGSSALYGVLQTAGTPTHTASGLTLVLVAELL